MDTLIPYTSDRLYELFTMQALAIYKAHYLLSGDIITTLSDEQIQEIMRELRCAHLMADRYFNMLQEKGIPEHLLSYHLQVEL